MKWPKRFKMHEAAGVDDGTHNFASVLLTRGKLVASDGHVLAVVPVLPEDDYSGKDLPQFEPGEGEGPAKPALLPLEAVKAATQGKTGNGQLKILTGEYGEPKEAAFGRPGEGKAWTSAPLQEGAFPESWVDHSGLKPPAMLADALERVGADTQMVEVILDAERLVKAARAIGAAHGLRVRFYMRDGKLDDRTPVLELRPAREPEGGPWAALGGQVIE